MKAILSKTNSLSSERMICIYRSIIVYALWFGILLLLLPKYGFPIDYNFWARWATYIHRHGLGNIYQVEDNNYNPFYHYILYLYAKLAGNRPAIWINIHWLKAFTLLFDFASAIIAASFIKNYKKRLLLSFALLLNIGYLYNSWIWGQVDAIYTCFTFIAVALAVRKQPIWSMTFYMLSLNAKTQAIIFLPVLLLLWLPLWVNRPKMFPLAIVTTAIFQFFIIIPFIWLGQQNYLTRIISININSVGFYDIISMGSYNFWHLILNW